MQLHISAVPKNAAPAATGRETMAEHDYPIRTFRYAPPDKTHARKVVWLGKTDRIFATVQVMDKGGETNLHSHAHLDGFWFVLSGRVRFYSDETTLVAELGPREGIVVPRGVKYWFESAGDEVLELLQVEGSDVAMKTSAELMSDRVDFNERKTESRSVHEEADGTTHSVS
jgi:mannose-6-phosphate isomerase-like protein (cupin superfamily)